MEVKIESFELVRYFAKGDHAIIHYPCHRSLCKVARVIGCEITRVVTGEEDAGELDLESLDGDVASFLSNQ